MPVGKTNSVVWPRYVYFFQNNLPLKFSLCSNGQTSALYLKKNRAIDEENAVAM